MLTLLTYLLNRSYFVTSYVYLWLHYLSILFFRTTEFFGLLSIIFFRMGEYQVRTASYYCPENLYHENRNTVQR